MFETLQARHGANPNIPCFNLALGEYPGRLQNVNVFNGWTLRPDDTRRDRSLEYADTPPHTAEHGRARVVA